jgi:hypothetical protein
MPDLIVGCPVSSREWILPAWFDAVIKACHEADLAPEFLFIVSRDDEESLGAMKDFKREHGNTMECIITDEAKRPDERIWDASRFHHMVSLRNQLIHRVRQVSPKYFWSLDSDIIPAPEALVEALANADPYAAVGMCTYMSPASNVAGNHWEVGREFPSKGTIFRGKLCNRQHKEIETGTQQVDCIMASKVMKREAYSVDYEWHRDGEDVGWSAACGRAGLKLGWCASAKCKHVMRQGDLEKVDFRVGF